MNHFRAPLRPYLRAFSTNYPVLQQAASAAATEAKVGTTKNYINGEFVESSTDRWIELRNPVSNGLPRLFT